MAVSGNDIHRVGAGEGCHVEVRQFADQLLLAPALTVECQKERTDHEKHGSGCQCGKPVTLPRRRLTCGDAFFDTGAKGGVRGEPLASRADGELLLQMAQTLSRAGGASA